MLLLVSFLLPLLFALGISAASLRSALNWRRRHRGLVIAAPITALPAAALSIWPGALLPADPGNVLDSGEIVELSWLVMGTSFSMDPAGRALTLITAVLYAGALGAISWVKLRHAEPGYGTVSAFLLLCFIGNIGAYLAADTVTFYLMFALMSLAATGLVAHYRTDNARRATRIYLVMTIISETALLAALLLIVSAGGRLISDVPEAIAAAGQPGLIMALVVIGFGVKAGTVPLHIWLPLAHPAAPAAASAVLSGALVKVGMFGLLRFMPWEFPDASPELEQISGQVGVVADVLLALSLFGAFAAALIAVTQSNPKVILAYSTISQMGFITALIGAGLHSAEVAAAAVAAAVVYAIHHGLAKGALFLGVSVVSHFGAQRARLLVLIGMVGAGLAVAGAPLTSGALGKYISKEAVSSVDVLGVGLDKLLPWVATGSTLILLRLAWVLIRKTPEQRRAPDGELFSWLGLCLAGILLPWLITATLKPESFLGVDWWGTRLWAESPFADSWIPGAKEYSMSLSSLWDASWPIGIGLLLGGAIWWLARIGRVPHGVTRIMERLPAGDLVDAEESVVDAGLRRVQAADSAVSSAGSRATGRISAAARAVQRRITAGFDATEAQTHRWAIYGLLIIAVMAVMVATVLGGRI